MVEQASFYGRRLDLQAHDVAPQVIRPEEQMYFQTIVPIMGALLISAYAQGREDARWQPDHSVSEPLPVGGPLGATFSVEVNYQAGTSRRVHVSTSGDAGIVIELSYPERQHFDTEKGQSGNREEQQMMSFSDLTMMLDNDDIIDNDPTSTPKDSALFALRYAQPAKIA